jgi:hypothetical protein
VGCARVWRCASVVIVKPLTGEDSTVVVGVYFIVGDDGV